MIRFDVEPSCHPATPQNGKETQSNHPRTQKGGKRTLQGENIKPKQNRNSNRNRETQPSRQSECRAVLQKSCFDFNVNASVSVCVAPPYFSTFPQFSPGFPARQMASNGKSSSQPSARVAAASEH